MAINYSEITPEIQRLAEICQEKVIPADLYTEHKVNRGLRDMNGNGIVTGLTNISQVKSKELVDGIKVPAEGKLYYRGIDVEDIVQGFIREQRFGFEETIYLLIFGRLPSREELDDFSVLLSQYRSLPPKFNRDIIMKAPSRDMMNTLARSILMLYYYDSNPDDISIPNVLRQCLQLVAQCSLLTVYGYHAYNHYEQGQSLIIHRSDPFLSIAENTLSLLRADQRYTELEARILDLALVLHADHGGGNNSTFSVRVVSSTGTDTYSAMAAGLGSLKGPKHGGANIMVTRMMEDMKLNVKTWNDEGQVIDYLRKLINRQAFDHSGLIYGVGHAVYTLSDPRAKVFETFVQKLSAEKHREEEYQLYATVARLGPQIIEEELGSNKEISSNIDFYSGFVYRMLDLPMEMFTPIFAISRIAGWSAHRIEELVNSSKIVRPDYKSVAEHRSYIPLSNR
jgi:citrate synthase